MNESHPRTNGIPDTRVRLRAAPDLPSCGVREYARMRYAPSGVPALGGTGMMLWLLRNRWGERIVNRREL